MRIVTQDWWDLVPALRERRIDIGIGELELRLGGTLTLLSIRCPTARFGSTAGRGIVSARAKSLTVQQIGEYGLVSPKLPKRACEFGGHKSRREACGEWPVLRAANRMSDLGRMPAHRPRM